ncbi:hypothetical protein J3R83DRAFT_12228 [Lanmaoa asiatica]|nr:hypothetical protein J3R83DRAFT_12228 [Lanmaoa asiatica]
MPMVYDEPAIISGNDKSIRATNDFVVRLTRVHFLVPICSSSSPRSPWRQKREASYITDSAMFEALFRGMQERIKGEDRLGLTSTLLKTAERHSLSERENSRLAGTMYAAGAETSLAVMAWWMLAMVVYPETQKRAQAELDAIVGRDRLPTLAGFENLPCIRAMTKGALGWRPVDDWYEGHFIPAGTIVIPNVWHLNGDPDTYGEDAGRFNPARHLDEKGRVAPGPTDSKEEGHFTYGFGRRICVGRHVANNSLFIDIATVLCIQRTLAISQQTSRANLRLYRQATSGSYITIMTINVVNPFKSQTAKTFDKSKIGRDMHVGDCFPSADVNLYSGKKFFKFGTTTTVMDGDLPKLKSLEHAKVVQSSSLFNACTGIHAEKQKKILSKVKSAKKNITKLFKTTGRVAAAVPCIDPFAIPSVEHNTTDDHSPSLSLSILQYAKPKACMVTTYESAPPQHTDLEAIPSPTAYGENVVDERIELTSAFCSVVEGASPSLTGQLLGTPASHLDTFPSTFSLNELHTIEEEGGSTEVVGVVNSEKELAISGSYISWSNSDSEVTVYLSSDTLSDHTTAHGVDLVSSEASASPLDTSFATSVDAEDSHQFSSGVLRGLRRVPNYEDLRNLQIIADHDFSCSDMTCGSSACDFSYGTASGINAAPLRRLGKCNNLRESFLSSEPKICTPSTRQMNKYRKFRAWLSMRCHESSRDMQKTPASGAPSEPQKVTPVSRSRQFLQSIFHPSSRVQAHVFKPLPHQLSPPPSPPVWSCAKITRSSSKAKKRRRMMKQSMKGLKGRLDSMDVDPCIFKNTEKISLNRQISIFFPSTLFVSALGTKSRDLESRVENGIELHNETDAWIQLRSSRSLPLVFTALHSPHPSKKPWRSSEDHQEYDDCQVMSCEIPILPSFGLNLAAFTFPRL